MNFKVFTGQFLAGNGVPVLKDPLINHPAHNHIGEVAV
jgi:hypothetical protein